MTPTAPISYEALAGRADDIFRARGSAR
jgi:hypothetical protein